MGLHRRCLCRLIALGFGLALSGTAGAAERLSPWLADIAYDTPALDRMDIYRPQGFDSVAAVLFIHGGGWFNGDKGFVPPEDVSYFTRRGIAFVAINTRNVPMAESAGIYPPVLGPLRDAQRALQFLRYHAREFAIDPDRIALLGESAGGFDALWLGLAADRAKPQASDPVERMSTRVRAVGAIDAQTTIDPAQMRRWVGPQLNYGSHAFGLDAAAFDEFLARRGEFQPYFASLSPAELVGSASPPSYLFYTHDRDASATDPMYYVHSPDFGLGFLRIAAERHAAVTLRVGAKANPAGRAELMDFLARALR